MDARATALVADHRQQGVGVPAVRHDGAHQHRHRARRRRGGRSRSRHRPRDRAQDGLQRTLRLSRSARSARGSPSPRRRATSRAPARRPMAITNNLNFGNPRRPEVYFQLREAVARNGRGVSRARARRSPAATCRSTTRIRRGAVYPTPVIGMVGIIESLSHVTRAGFQRARRRDRAARRADRRAWRQRVSGAHPRRRRRRAARAAISRPSARSSTRCSRRSRRARALGARLQRRRTGRRAGRVLHWRTASGRSAPTSISRRGRALPPARAPVRRGTGARRRLARRMPDAVLDDRARHGVPARRHRSRCARTAVRTCACGVGSRQIDAPLARLATRITRRFRRIMGASARPQWRYCRAASSSSRRDSHMCGIFGVHGHPDAPHLAQLGLYSLQHRGQESAGIVAVDDAGVGARACAAWAWSPTGSRRADAARCTGAIAIGHTRYSTAGSSTIENAQPVLARFRGGYITLAHNGNLINAAELRMRARGAGLDLLVDDGLRGRSCTASPARRSDARRSSSPTRSSGVEGAYSLVVAIGDTLLAARDPRGWRPLAMGTARRRRTSSRRRPARSTSSARRPCATSSRARSSSVDGDGVRSMLPLRATGARAAACSSTCTSRAPTAASSAARSIARAARSDGGSRASARRPAPISCSAFPTRPTPPRSASPRRAGCRYELALIRNHYVGRTFIQPTQAGRDAKVKVKYNAVREVLDGKSVVMVDDSIVRGTTTRGLVAHGPRGRRARGAHARQLGAGHRARATTASIRRRARS